VRIEHAFPLAAWGQKLAKIEWTRMHHSHVACGQGRGGGEVDKPRETLSRGWMLSCARLAHFPTAARRARFAGRSRPAHRLYY